MPFNINLTVTRAPEADVKLYRLYRQDSAQTAPVQVAETPQPTAGDPTFTLQIPEPEFSTLFTATAVDTADNEGTPGAAFTLAGDRVAPATLGAPKLVAMVWVP